MRKAVQTIAVLCGIVAMIASGSLAQTGAAVTQIPKFRAEGSWPKLPDKWIMAIVSSTAIDEQDHLWVLQRPNTLSPEEKVKAAPPVLEFDAQGNFIQGWGGPGAGYDWPETEHGIYIDPKGFVWIGGNGNEDQILKFTKAGKFVMQIGKGGHKKTNKDTENFWRPADVFVYPKTNELFVADGYGNTRIIVFDADNGKFKRMWGAFGNTPEDVPARPRGKGGERVDPHHIAAKEIDPKDPGPKQFNTVHGVKVSNDGLVYVSDRGGKRVQVFTVEGKYVTQAYVDRWCEAPHCGNGHTVASTAFSADPAQRFLYVASRSPERIWIYDRKTLTPLDSFGRPGIAPGEFYVLHHMTSDSKGNLYSSEVEDGRRIQKFVFKGIGPVPAK